MDNLGIGSGSTNPAATPSQKPVLLDATAGKGISVNGAVEMARGGGVVLKLDVGNTGPESVSALAIQLNKNCFGIAPESPQVPLGQSISNGTIAPTVTVKLVCTPTVLDMTAPALKLQAAVKNMTTSNVAYFSIPIPMEFLFVQGAPMPLDRMLNGWNRMDSNQEASIVLKNIRADQAEDIKAKLGPSNVYFVSQQDVPNQTGQFALFFSCQTALNATFVTQVMLKEGLDMAKITVKSANKAMSELCKQTVARLMS